MEVAALIVSIISIIFSLLLAIIELHRSKKINDVNLDADILKIAIQTHLIEKIPEAIIKINFVDGKLKNIGDLQTAILGLINSLKFYKYYDGEFYEKLKKEIQALEDYLVLNEDRHFDEDDSIKVRQNITKHTKNIYKIIKKQYRNG